MTIELTRPETPSSWGDMPGWGIVADMTPPELIERRLLAVLRRRIVLGLILVVLLCVAGYGYARLQHAAADNEATAASDQTRTLTTSAAKFTGITHIETTVSGLDGQVATVMRTDMDMARTVTSIRRALPSSMSISSVAVTMSADDSVDGASTLDAAGRPKIGTVSISGAGRSLEELPAFVDSLAVVRGFVNVLPTSNQVSKGVSQFSVTLDLNDLLYSHRYDLGTPGSS
jgi:hypothetical protein